MTESDPAELGLVQRASSGDQVAFDELVGRALPRLRSLVRRLVGHPDETDDLVQETLARAWEAVARFRGEAAFATWLCAIGTRASIDHLRKQKRWRKEAQVVYANECRSNPELAAEVGAAFADPSFAYDVREHIAYCLTCVGRTLPPEEQAAIVLRDVMDLSNDEAARAVGMSRSVFRHRLAAARSQMQATFEGLCSLVGKTGVCYQCKGLRDAAPEGRKGREPPSLGVLDERCELVKTADLDGCSRPLHDLFFRRTAELERTGEGDVSPGTCATD